MDAVPIHRCRKATDEQLLASYARTRSVHATGRELGMNGASVHERLKKLGATNPKNILSKTDRETIRIKYDIYANAGKLADLAAQLGRTKPLLCRYARQMDLTNPRREKRFSGKWKYLSEIDAAILMDDFKASRLGLLAFCKKRGFDDLGFGRTLRKFFPDEYEHVIESKTPRQTKYRLGRQFEYRTRDHFKALGYLVARSPASKSAVDLFIIGRAVILLIQCKRGGGLGVAAWNEIFDLADSVGGKAILATMGIGGRGIELFEIIGRKDGSKRRQPMLPFSIGPNKSKD